MVIVQGSITAGTVTAGTAICTLPVEYRPSYNKAFPVYVDSDGKSEIGLYMSTTGNLTIRLPASSTIVAGKAIALNFMYQAA